MFKLIKFLIAFSTILVILQSSAFQKLINTIKGKIVVNQVAIKIEDSYALDQYIKRNIAPILKNNNDKTFIWWLLNKKKVLLRLKQLSLIEDIDINFCSYKRLNCLEIKIIPNKITYEVISGDNAWLANSNGEIIIPLRQNKQKLKDIICKNKQNCLPQIVLNNRDFNSSKDIFNFVQATLNTLQSQLNIKVKTIAVNQDGSLTINFASSSLPPIVIPSISKDALNNRLKDIVVKYQSILNYLQTEDNPIQLKNKVVDFSLNSAVVLKDFIKQNLNNKNN